MPQGEYTLTHREVLLPPGYLLRDRDAIVGQEFRQRVTDAWAFTKFCPHRDRPWQRADAEPVIGSVRRECLDHVMVIHESSLRRTLASYFQYYHRSRAHLSLGKDSPEPLLTMTGGAGMGYAPGMGQSPLAVLVRGSGIAASCCLRLLQGGHIVAPDPASRPKLPALLISQRTQNLLADVFQTADLFYGLPAIRRRVVAWGGKEVVVMPHAGVVISEKEILERLRARVAELDSDLPIENPAWTIYSTRPTNPATTSINFGTRMAVVNDAELVEGADHDTCWVESVECGWLFLVPTGEGFGSLIAVGGPGEQLLENSHLAGRYVRKLGKSAVEFAAYPRILSKLCGDGWLACGSAAMSFDPLCGEGAGNAAREAILACAAVQAIFAGEPRKEVLAEYSLRLTLGFLRHLEKCREFYSGRIGNQFWSSELELVEKGVAWAKSRLARAPNSRFRLVGFALERAIRDKTD